MFVLVLLPPSETKALGGEGPPLDLDALSWPDLSPPRRKLADAVVELAADVPASLVALGLSVRQQDEVSRNAELWTAPTVPALRRYTGVLYDALGFASFSRRERKKAHRRLVVASALFGLVGGADPIPAYRLSGASTLPAVGGLRSFWRPTLEPVLAEIDDLVVDLRSGTYAALAPIAGAVSVRVVTEDATGRRLTVSHHNKMYKGRLAAVLVRLGREPSTVDGLARAVSRAGLTVEVTADRSLELLATD